MAHASVDVSRVSITTWRASERDNGSLRVSGLLDDRRQGGTFIDRLTTQSFTLHVRDADGSFDVTAPLAPCSRRRTDEIVCVRGGPQPMRFTLVPEPRKAAAPQMWRFQLRLRGLPDSVTGVPGTDSNPMTAPLQVHLRRDGAVESDALTTCRVHGRSGMTCDAR